MVEPADALLCGCDVRDIRLNIDMDLSKAEG